MGDPGSVPSSDPRAAKRTAIRRASLHLLVGVIAVHSVALTIYYLAGIQDTSPRTRTTFTTVWLFVTAIVVAVLLKRVRQVRRSRSGPRLR